MSVIRRDPRLLTATVVSAVLIVAFALLYVFSEKVGAEGLRWVNLFANPLAALTSTILCFILWRSSRKGEVLRRVWGFLGIGLLMWTVAEVIYGVADLTSTELPFPSLADAFWVPGYIPLFIALFLRFRSLRITPPGWQMAVLLIGMLAASIVSTAFVITPNFAAAQQTTDVSELERGLTLALAVLYPVGDLLVVLGVALTILVLLGGELSRPWLLIAIGCLSIAFSDSLYYYGYASNTYNSDVVPINLITAISDVTYFSGYVVMALGFYIQARIQKAL